MEPITNAYIAIGSNIDPARRISDCLEWLARIPHSRLFAQSSWYQTTPWGVEEQADFINLVVGLATGLSAESLLSETQSIESRLNRVRTQKYGPRTIDLDILLFGEAVIETDHLTIPHPALLERDFMLEPLIEIAPQCIHPIFNAPVNRLIDRIRYRQIKGRLDSGSEPTQSRD